MIAYFIILYLGLISIILVDPNPLWTLPLVLVLIGNLWRKKWLSLFGLALFCVVTVGRIGDVSLTELPNLFMIGLTLVLPLIGLFEIILSPSPYRLDKVSIAPIVITTSLLSVFILALFFVIRILRIGIYLNSDPTLQVFILMSLSILLTGPILLGSRPSPAREDLYIVPNEAL